MSKFKSLLNASQRITFEKLPSKLQAHVTRLINESSVKHFEVTSMDYNVDGLAYKELSAYIETASHLYVATYNERWDEVRVICSVPKSAVKLFLLTSENYRKEVRSCLGEIDKRERLLCRN